MVAAPSIKASKHIAPINTIVREVIMGVTCGAQFITQHTPEEIVNSQLEGSRLVDCQ